MSKRANSIGIALLAIGTINSIIALVSIEGDEVEPRRRRDAAIERVSAVYDWDELERTGWKTKEAQVASFRQVPARPAPPSNQWDCPPDATVITRRRGQIMTTEKQSFTTDKEFAALTAAASTILARELTRVETNAERKAKKQRVLDKKWDCFVRTFPELAADVRALTDLDALVRRGLPLDRAITLLVDLAFSDPFSPYELKFKPKDFHNSLVSVASLLGVSEERVEQLEKTQKDAMRAHKHVAWGKVVLWGAGGTIVLAVGGWIAAPWIAGGIGAAAGLTGAAATAHGLAVLGGGSLALGGFGMAGGMWIVTGTAAAAGMGVLGGGTLLLQLGAAQVKIELLKLQVSYREVLLLTQAEVGKSQEVITNLENQREEINAKLKEERELNDKNAHRIEELDAILLAVDDSLKWIKEQKAA